jgi:hypothetical protein
MLLMLGALWYDYKVARPAVENAYQRIAKLNQTVNETAGHKYMTEKEVQQELQRQPIETFSENGYFIEVYGWRAGVPTRHHKYFAVYTEGAPHIFQTHAMNEFDRELIRLRTVSAGEMMEMTGNMPLLPMAPPAGFNPDEEKRGKGPTEDLAKDGQESPAKDKGESTEGDSAPATPPSESTPPAATSSSEETSAPKASESSPEPKGKESTEPKETSAPTEPAKAAEGEGEGTQPKADS